MIKLIEKILAWLRGGTLRLLILAGIVLAIWGTLSPVGVLLWWLAQGSESLGLKKDEPAKQLQPTKVSNTAPKSAKNCYIIFLPGVGDFSPDQLTSGEEVFFKRLNQKRPKCVLVKDVFPYSVINDSLGGERALAPLWRFAEEAKGVFGVAGVLINIRNLWRFAISYDNRYGPVYNQGIANVMIDRMNAAQALPPANRRLHIILIATSGGAQVALGATKFLDEWLNNAQIDVVSVGGVFGGVDGFKQARLVYHLRGTRDWVEKIGGVVFPSRWPWTVGSPFNLARQAKRYQAMTSGPHEHDGAQGYFGRDKIEGKNITYVDLTVKDVNNLSIWSGKNK